jgi:hypothetical protein
LADGAVASNALVVARKWSGDLCTLSLKNTSTVPVQLREVIVFDLQHQLADTTKLYGEGFQKLQQIGGTLGKPEDWGTYNDRSHYKIPEPENLRTAYGMLTLQLRENSGYCWLQHHVKDLYPDFLSMPNASVSRSIAKTWCYNPAKPGVWKSFWSQQVPTGRKITTD